MKKFYFILLSIFSCLISFAQPNVAVVNKGEWTNNNTWSLKHVPQNGEVVEVPKGMTVVVSENVQLTAANLEIKVMGELQLNVGKLDLGYNSRIIVFESGKINTIKNNGADKISIGGIVKYTGSEGDLKGYLVATKSTGLAPNGFMKAEPVILPVKFASFGVATQNGLVLVQWSTAEEITAAYFEVQRSYDAIAWTPIGQVKAVGNSRQLNHYHLADKSALGAVIYYRIRQVDEDGKAIFTTVQAVKKAIASGVSIIAARQKVAIQFAQPVKGKIELQLVSLSGNVVARQVVTEARGLVLLNTATAVKGNYFVTVSNGQEINLSKQVVL